MSQRRKRAAPPTKSAKARGKARKASKPAKGRAEKRIVIKPAAAKVEGPDEIEAIKLAMEMHKAGKTIEWVRKRMERILVDENNKPLDPSFLMSQFEAFNYRYKSTEKRNLRRKPDRRLDKDLDSRCERIERYFVEKFKDDTPERAAQEDGFPEGWIKHTGGDEDHYDMYIDRYSKKGLVTVWKDRGDFWWWGPADGSKTYQTLVKYEAIEAAEQWLKKSEQG